jgi:GTPase SAR1 family protein
MLQGNEDYRAFIDKLAGTNVSNHVELPMIAVMGDTSSGKSSLLTSIANVELPSSDELTTRCPIMLQMRRADDRSATVTVQWKDKPSGKSDADLAFPPGHVNESNWPELTNIIAEAQEHIIQMTGKEVARDIVNVKVAGPSCEDLTLIDLPGIVRAIGAGESETLAQDIQSLMEDYLKNSRCVILAVHPSNVDFHNSQIMADAKKVDPKTKRTLPVLTKPDLIDDGAERSVKDLLLGLKTDAFEKGFHMVKGRGQAALNSRDTIEKGLKDEEVFFRNTQPWRDVTERSIFGTFELRKKLGEIQMQLVRDTFPSVTEEMIREKDKAESELLLLGNLPASPSEQRLFFFEIKDRLVRRTKVLLSGSTLRDLGFKPKHVYSAVFHKQYETFQDQMRQGRLAGISKIKEGSKVIAMVGNEEFHGSAKRIIGENAYLNVDQVNFRGPPVFCCEPPVGIVPGDVFDSDKGRVMLVISSNSHCRLLPFPMKKLRRDPEWIQNLIQDNRPYTLLPVFVNNEVFERIVSDFVEEDWKQPCMIVVQKMSRLLKDALAEVVQHDDKLKMFPRLEQFVVRRLDAEVDKSSAEAQLQVEDFVKREKIPYTQNHYLNENFSKLRTKHLLDAIVESFDSSSEEPTITRKSAKNIIQGVFDRNQRKDINQHMAEDMEFALDAYGKVSLKRFIDVIPMICGDILLGFSDKMNQVLSDTSDVDIEKLVSGSRDDVTKRKNLQRKVDELREGLEIFEILM